MGLPVLSVLAVQVVLHVHCDPLEWGAMPGFGGMFGAGPAADGPSQQDPWGSDTRAQVNTNGMTGGFAPGAMGGSAGGSSSASAGPSGDLSVHLSLDMGAMGMGMRLSKEDKQRLLAERRANCGPGATKSTIFRMTTTAAIRTTTPAWDVASSATKQPMLAKTSTLRGDRDWGSDSTRTMSPEEETKFKQISESIANIRITMPPVRDIETIATETMKTQWGSFQQGPTQKPMGFSQGTQLNQGPAGFAGMNSGMGLMTMLQMTTTTQRPSTAPPMVHDFCEGYREGEGEEIFPPDSDPKSSSGTPFGGSVSAQQNPNGFFSRFGSMQIGDWGK